MSWQCKLLNITGTRLIKYDPPLDRGLCGETLLVDRDGLAFKFNDLPIGSMWYVPERPTREPGGETDRDVFGWPWYLAKPDRLADYYYQHNGNRRPLMVILPGRDLFVVDGKCWNREGMYGGWQVSGIAPLITVQPSINLVGSYHGWLKDGAISDDCEGRKYDAMGRRV